MNVYIFGDFNKAYLGGIVKEADRLIKFPKELGIYFVDEHNYDKIKIWNNKSLKSRLSSSGASFAYSYMGKNAVIINITQNKNYLLNSKKAIVGLLLHEIMHITLMENGIDAGIMDSFNKAYLAKFVLLKNLPSTLKKLREVFLEIGQISILLLKDLYSNSELIRLGLGDYVLENYLLEFKHTKTCPRPVFYDKFRQAVKREIDVVKIAFEFEFALLSVILPFQRYNFKAKSLVAHFDQCYELNIYDLSRKCHELVDTYNHYFGKSGFNERFFSEVFLKVYYLLE